MQLVVTHYYFVECDKSLKFIYSAIFFSFSSLYNFIFRIFAA